nr:SH3 domain-containing protein C23A1.17-like [Aegilops tauschii subsp. strangulata]
MHTCPRGPPAINAAAPQSTCMRVIRAASHPSRTHPHVPCPTPVRTRRGPCRPPITPPEARMHAGGFTRACRLPDATAAACRRCRLLACRATAAACRCACRTPPLPPLSAPRLPDATAAASSPPSRQARRLVCPAAWHAPSGRVVRGGRGSKRLPACRAIINAPMLIAPASHPRPPLPRIAPPTARRFIKAQPVPPTPTPSLPRPHPHPSHRRPPSMAFFRISSSTGGGGDDDDKPGAWPTSIGVPETVELHRYCLPVPPGYRLPRNWKIDADGYATPGPGATEEELRNHSGGRHNIEAAVFAHRLHGTIAPPSPPEIELPPEQVILREDGDPDDTPRYHVAVRASEATAAAAAVKDAAEIAAAIQAAEAMAPPESQQVPPEWQQAPAAEEEEDSDDVPVDWDDVANRSSSDDDGGNGPAVIDLVDSDAE